MMTIRFEGTFTGETAKYYLKRTYRFDRILFGGSGALIFPLIVLFAIRVQDLRIIPAYIFVVAVAIGITFFPLGNKEYMQKAPRSIYIANGQVTCSGKGYQETRPLERVKEVRDWGAFYELRFRGGKFSAKFLCQKDLLEKGSIKRFEALFDGIIVRM